MMTNKIIGTPIKVYRRWRCVDCGKCYEYDIENISMEGEALTIICPWCNTEHRNLPNESFFPNYDDRSVRCD